MPTETWLCCGCTCPNCGLDYVKYRLRAEIILSETYFLHHCQRCAYAWFGSTNIKHP